MRVKTHLILQLQNAAEATGTSEFSKKYLPIDLMAHKHSACLSDRNTNEQVRLGMIFWDLFARVCVCVCAAELLVPHG